MRVYLKRELVNNLQILDRSHDALQQLIQEQKNEEAYQLLIGCQKGAISIGEAINAILGKTESVTAAKLEDYCEMLYQVGEEGKEFDRGAFRRKIGEAIAALDAEAPTGKIKIVFMPYKAALWDCMESIYEAALDDDECEITVVPLPYYNINAAEKTKELVDETALFPEELPIVSYKEYRLAQEHPEIIYIHNPWDQGNVVTQIHPDYYSSVLTHNCEKLIYVPYGLFGAHLPQTHLMAPAYSNCDLIVLANENHKKELADAGTAPSKLFVAGSPKFDRVIRDSREKKPLPDKWKEIIGKKKVVFYNTSISDMLRDGKRELNKMQQVYEAFRGKENITLLWRPHPLLRQTLVSMEPELLKEYDRIRDLFRANPNMIVDETPDMGTAVSNADYYLGDAGSSLTVLFGVAGKPVFLLNQDIKRGLKEEEIEEYATKAAISWNACTDEAGDYYSIDGLTGAVIRLRADFQEVSILGYVPVDIFEYCLSPLGYVVYQNRLYFVSANSGLEIACFDLKTKQTEKVYSTPLSELPFMAVPGANPSATTMARVGHYLVVAGGIESALVRFDMDTGEGVYMGDPVDKLMDANTRREGIQPPFFGSVAAVKGSTLFLVSRQFPAVVEVNVETGAALLVQLGDLGHGFEGIYAVENDFWLTPNDHGGVVCWNRETGMVREFTNYPEGFVYDSDAKFHRETLAHAIPFRGAGKIGSEVVLFPWHAGMALAVDPETNQVRQYSLKKENIPFPTFFSNGCYVTYAGPEDGKVVYTVFNDYYGYVVDSESGETERIPMARWDEESLEILRKMELGFVRCSENFPYAFREDFWRSAERIAEYLNEGVPGFDRERQLQEFGRRAENLDGSAGQKIHEKAIDLIFDR